MPSASQPPTGAMAGWIASDTGVQARAAVAEYLEQLAPAAEQDREHHDE